MARSDVRNNWGALLEAWVFPLLTVALFVFFCFLPLTAGLFNTIANLQILLAGQAVIVFVTLAVLVPIIVNVWDFTPGANAGLTAIVAAGLLGAGVAPILALLAGLGSALVVAGLNSLLVVGLRVNSVIATLGTTILISGAVLALTSGGSLVKGIPDGLIQFGYGKVAGIPNLAFLAVAILIVMNLILTKTVFGRRLFAVGSNRRAAHLVGLRTNGLTISAFLISGALAGFGGILVLAQTGAGNAVVGPSYTLPAFAAVFLGTVAVRPGVWNVWGTAWAIAFLAILGNGLVLAGANAAVTQVANGLALLIGVSVSNLVARQRGKVPQVA